MNDLPEQEPIATAQIAGTRDYQEDALEVQVLAPGTGVDAGEYLLVLADGMGGYAGGDVASKLAVSRFCEAYPHGGGDITASLSASLEAANEGIAGAVAAKPELRGMGTTLIGSVIKGDLLYWISVGDSPLWVCRESALHRLNADHSMTPVLDELVAAGQITSAEALADFRNNQLRSAVTGKTIALVDICQAPFRLQAGDIVVLASDGVETLAEAALVDIFRTPGRHSPYELVHSCMQAIEEINHPWQDNATMILYRH